MDKLLIEKSAKTPNVSFDPKSGVFELSGRSIPENAVHFYKPIYDWLDLYVKSPADCTTLSVKLEYFNTSSSKCLLDVFKKLEFLIKNETGDAKIDWFFEDGDEDMQEAGADYDIIIDIPFGFIEVEEL